MTLSLQVLRQSVSELLAAAVCDLFPEAQLVDGEGTDIGFYYDFVIKQPIDEQALPIIEEKMRALIKADLEVKPMEMMRQNASDFFKHHRQKLKAEILSYRHDVLVEIIKIGGFYDLCSPPYIKRSKEAGAFKLQKIIPMTLTHPYLGEIAVIRIEGTAFPDSYALKKFLKKAEAAKKRDHRLLGQEMALFSMHDEANIGSVFWHPKGMFIREWLLDWWRNEQRTQRFQQVSTPRFIKQSFLKKAGSHDFSQENEQLSTCTFENVDYVASRGNSVQHALIFIKKSYCHRDLPVRYAECTECYTNERTSQLWGMLRTRTYCVDNAHIFCTPEQVYDELISSLQFIDKTIKMFGFEYHWYLVPRGSKCAGTVDKWNKTSDLMSKALKASGFEYAIDKEAHSFLGPRIEARLVDSLGREWEGPYIGMDFYHPEKMGLRYQGPGDTKHIPVMINRSLLGSIERFVAILVEHYAGLFPLWLAPEQVRVIPVGDKNGDRAAEIRKVIESRGFRTGIDYQSNKLGAKIHAAEIEKVPYMIIVGDKEEKSGLVTVRSCNSEGMRTGVVLDQFLDQLKEEESLKSLPKQLPEIDK